jgi:hypothetical protein
MEKFRNRETDRLTDRQTDRWRNGERERERQRYPKIIQFLDRTRINNVALVSFIQSFSFKDATIVSKSSPIPKPKMRKIRKLRKIRKMRKTWWNISTPNISNSLLPTNPFVASGGFIGRRSRWSVYALL